MIVKVVRTLMKKGNKGNWVIENQTQEVWSERQYLTFLDGCKMAHQTQGTFERNTMGSTKYGLIVVRHISISPDKTDKVQWDFIFE